MTFTASTYGNFVAERSTAQERLILQYLGPSNDFDIVVVGSGIGGGVLADDLAERLGTNKRILLLEAGSYLYPTHVYNICRFANASVARHFGCDTFWQNGDPDAEYYIGEKPQLGFGGRSIFWSGLIPSVQGWELDFFPNPVRQDLQGGLLNAAGDTMNESRSMGSAARAIVSKLRQSPLAADFSIQETPRALHQPYLTASGVASDEFFTEPTGVFNTAELIVNQLGLTPGVSHGDGPGLQLLLNSYVEDVRRAGDGYELVARNTLTGDARTLRAATVVLACGSIESPKLLRRSSMYPGLQQSVQDLIGRGLTDHPTTNEITTHVSNIGQIPIPRSAHAKIIFYSRGLRDEPDRPNEIRYPFNIEMNINHEYWHLRENDVNDPARSFSGEASRGGPSRVDIKFSFGNCLDDGNEIKRAPDFGYVPEIAFRNLRWMDQLADARFPALAGWRKDYAGIFAVLNSVTDQVFTQFQIDGRPARPDNNVWYGDGGKGFGGATVHHAVGTLRMPYRPALDRPFADSSVVDADLQVVGSPNLFVCDMSVMPFSSAANPVRSLVGLALRLSRRLG